MDDFIEIGGNLVTYTTENLPKQIDFDNRIHLMPTTLGKVEWKPISEIGIKAPPSLVTAEIREMREQLQLKLRKNLYYQLKSYQLSDDYTYRRVYNSSLDSDLKYFMKDLSELSNRYTDLLL